MANRFRALKHKVVHEADLSQVWLYYLDHFIDDPDFLSLGDETQDDFLEGVIPQICRQMFTKSDRLGILILTLIPDYNFIHGGLEIGGRLGNLIYFKDIQKGVIAVPNKRTEKAEVNYARFSNPLLGRSPVDLNLN